MHTLIFGGTALLFLGKIIRLFSFGGLTNPPQSIYLYASLVAEIGAVLIFIGGGMAIYRRYIKNHLAWIPSLRIAWFSSGHSF